MHNLFYEFRTAQRVNKTVSKFYRKTAKADYRSPEHVMFSFNDAAEGTQHSTLRNLPNTIGIKPESVMYVFPRITEKTDFINKVGNLIQHSSFVPVVEIDHQAAKQTPQIVIGDGVSHKFRTSYDGLISEVNFFFFFFAHDNTIISGFLSELICIQIERLAKLLSKQDESELEILLDIISDSLNQFVAYELKQYPANDLLIENVKIYIQKIIESYNANGTIPDAPTRFTNIIPEEGLKLKLESQNDLSRINYQIF